MFSDFMGCSGHPPIPLGWLQPGWFPGMPERAEKHFSSIFLSPSYAKNSVLKTSAGGFAPAPSHPSCGMQQSCCPWGLDFGIAWELHRNNMGFHGMIACNFIIFHGIAWITWELYGIIAWDGSRLFNGIPCGDCMGTAWVGCMVFNGIPWGDCMGLHGIAWNCMGFHGMIEWDSLG